MCILCEKALRHLSYWRESRRDISLDALLAQLPAFLSAPANDMETAGKKIA